MPLATAAKPAVLELEPGGHKGLEEHWGLNDRMLLFMRAQFTDGPGAARGPLVRVSWAGVSQHLLNKRTENPQRFPHGMSWNELQYSTLVK